MFIDEENPEKLKQLGLKIKAAKMLREEIIGFFVKDGKPVYDVPEYHQGAEWDEWTGANETQWLLDIVNMYIRGENTESFIEGWCETEKEQHKKLFDLMGLEFK